jgi:hypothetical protein
MPRCSMKAPPHWGAIGAEMSGRWLASGGSPLVFGHCDADCPMGLT